VTISDHNSGIWHIGGLTVFSSEGRGLYGTRYVTGVHEAVPTTAARQSPKRFESQQSFNKWAENQLDKLDDLKLTDHEKGEALLSIHAITNDLGQKYFLFDLTGRIVHFANLEISVNDKLFIICYSHPHVNRIEISSYQGTMAFTSPANHTKSYEYRYVMQLHSSIQEKYRLVELFGQDYSSNLSTALGRLFAEIRRLGFEPSRSDLTNQVIGTYTGPEGGGHPLFYNHNIKTGMPIDARGIVITVGKAE